MFLTVVSGSLVSPVRGGTKRIDEKVLTSNTPAGACATTPHLQVVLDTA